MESASFYATFRFFPQIGCLCIRIPSHLPLSSTSQFSRLLLFCLPLSFSCSTCFQSSVAVFYFSTVENVVCITVIMRYLHMRLYLNTGAPAFSIISLNFQLQACAKRLNYTVYLNFMHSLNICKLSLQSPSVAHRYCKSTKFGVHAVYDRRHLRMLVATNISPNSPNIIAHQDLLIYSIPQDD